LRSGHKPGTVEITIGALNAIGGVVSGLVGTIIGTVLIDGVT
jgi:hypothetical protein